MRKRCKSIYILFIVTEKYVIFIIYFFIHELPSQFNNYFLGRFFSNKYFSKSKLGFGFWTF